MKNNKNIRKLKFDISVRPSKEAVPEIVLVYGRIATASSTYKNITN